MAGMVVGVWGVDMMGRREVVVNRVRFRSRRGKRIFFSLFLSGATRLSAVSDIAYALCKEVAGTRSKRELFVRREARKA